MKVNPKLLTAILAGALTAAPAFALTTGPWGQTASQDMKAAGHHTKNAARDAGRGVKTGTKKAYHKTKSGTKHVYHSTKRGTKKGYNKTKSTVKGAAHGAHEGAKQPQK